MESDYEKSALYHVETMSLEVTKEKIKLRNIAFECKLESTYGIENKNYMTHIYDNKVNKIAE